ncbi:hypothetical protein Pmani_038685 [Petrolisthes manimaculis]|uniref:Uncharacterized protein n=1 Tax=Petrolisthes manimaculis TaxID=1843537 RepID=A0AAE1NFS8_9EUCA|nr:hypothetical protein Pmani_038685 [Petrolisthes manimaculis]
MMIQGCQYHSKPLPLHYSLRNNITVTEDWELALIIGNSMTPSCPQRRPDRTSFSSRLVNWSRNYADFPHHYHFGGSRAVVMEVESVREKRREWRSGDSGRKEGMEERWREEGVEEKTRDWRRRGGSGLEEEGVG